METALRERGKCPYLKIKRGEALWGNEVCDYNYCELNEILNPIESGACENCEENKEGD